MKKLLTSLTILALISPISQIDVNAEDGLGGVNSATTNVTVQVMSAIDSGTRNISANENLNFKALRYSLEKEERTVAPATENSTINLTVNDTLIQSKGYTVKAQFLSEEAGNGKIPFPVGTYFNLSGADIQEGGEGYGSAPEAEEDIRLEIGNGEKTVLSAARTNNNQGIGTWTASFKVGNLTVTPPKELLKDGDNLGGNILWTISEASD